MRAGEPLPPRSKGAAGGPLEVPANWEDFITTTELNDWGSVRCPPELHKDPAVREDQMRWLFSRARLTLHDWGLATWERISRHFDSGGWVNTLIDQMFKDQTNTDRSALDVEWSKPNSAFMGQTQQAPTFIASTRSVLMAFGDPHTAIRAVQYIRDMINDSRTLSIIS